MSENHKVLMPSMGEGVNEATLVRWHCKPGDKVEAGQPLLEVSTDKVDTEVPSPVSGYLIACFADIEQSIYVDQIIAQISDNKNSEVLDISNEPSSPHKVEDKAPIGGRKPRKGRVGIDYSGATPVQSPVPISLAGIVRTSPLVRKLAEEFQVDLRLVRGTGLHGRITKGDVEEFIRTGGKRVAQDFSNEVAEDKGIENPIHRVKTTIKGDEEYLDGVKVRREKMSRIRRMTAEHMVRSVQASPHVTTTFEIDLARVVKDREQRQESFTKEHGFKLTFTPYFLAAAADAIKQFPVVNCSVDGGDVLYKEDINLGCAVAIDTGLIVPVVRGAGELDLAGLASALNDLVSRARAKELEVDALKGATFTITNPGMYGSIHSQPLINQPQVAIMSIGAIQRRPVFEGDKVVEGFLCQVGLTFDHRVIDGEGGAKFLAAVKQYLENFEG